MVGRAALKQVLGTAERTAGNGMAGALEEDARLTALFLWTLQSTEEDGGAAPPEPDGEPEEAAARATAGGFQLPFDVVRRFSQPMGIDLDHWTGRVIAQDRGIVRLLPVAERAEILFGTEGAGRTADWLETGANPDSQLVLFPDLDPAPNPPPGRGARGDFGSDSDLQSPNGTVLDRVHAAMLLQAGGHSAALRRLIASEGERGPDFLRLANALSALYPRGSREKRLLDAMLLAVPM